jgi:hypothetical protein
LETGEAGEDILSLSAFFMAVIEGLCGVSLSALSRGRYSATPHAPHDMAYQLLVPYHRGVMVYAKEAVYEEDF